MRGRHRWHWGKLKTHVAVSRPRILAASDISRCAVGKNYAHLVGVQLGLRLRLGLGQLGQLGQRCRRQDMNILKNRNALNAAPSYVGSDDRRRGEGESGQGEQKTRTMNNLI